MVLSHGLCFGRRQLTETRQERRAIRAGRSKPLTLLFRFLARAAGVEDPKITWRLTHGKPWFNSRVASLEIDRRYSCLRLEKTSPGDEEDPRLETVFEYALSR
jgi:hypothetical protein